MRIALPLSAALILIAAGCESRSDDGSKHAAKGGGAVPVSQGEKAPVAEAPAKRAPTDKSQLPPMPSGQTPAPELPADVDLSTTREELGAQALVLARAEVEGGEVVGITIPDRHLFIYQSWLPQMMARQADLQALADARAAEAQRQAKEVGHQAEWQRKMSASDAKYARELEDERNQPVPILDR